METKVVDIGDALDPIRPWPGLVPFSEGGASYFYGREAECEDLFRRVRRDTTTLLFGQSGLGKTSLLQAGLFPVLRREGFLPILVRIDYSNPNISPVAQVIAVFQHALAIAGVDIAGSDLAAEDGLWAYFHQIDRRHTSSDGRELIPVLVFDQFEEAFTLGLAKPEGREQTQAFLTELADLIEGRPPELLEERFDNDPGLVERYSFDRRAFRTIISLREDYLAALESMRARAPSLGQNRFRLLPMNGVQALRAVTRPGSAIISADVAQNIVRFVSRARQEDAFGPSNTEIGFGVFEVEPSLLSLFCRELNERRLKQGVEQITEELVSSSSQSVLQEFYERAFVDQPPALRSFVEEELITSSGFRESMALERARELLRQRGIGSEGLDLLIRRRLLRVEERLQVSRVEIIHDLLLEVIRTSRANRLQRRAAALLPGSWLERSPFRGLEPFRFEDSPIFFGRDQASHSSYERLEKNGEQGRPFLLVLGANGVGKTSMVQAGLVPALVRSSSGTTIWLRTFARPGSENPFAALAEGLTGPEGLPELADEHSRSEFAGRLAGAEGGPAGLIRRAIEFRQASQRASGSLPPYGVIRLILVVDQLEELFTSGVVSHAQRIAFIHCLAELLDTGSIYIVAAMRSAFWHRAAELPELIQLSDGFGRIDLPPPSPAELAEIIRKPADVAGLSYEIDSRTGISLDATISQDAAAELGVLPLLSFVLERLYVEDVSHQGNRILSYNTYHRLGGLRDAIAARAEDAVAKLSNEERTAIPRVLRAICSLTADGQTFVPRSVPLDAFPVGSSQRAVVDAMVNERLLVASYSGSTTVIRPAHDAILTNWSRARVVLDQARRDLELRALLEQQTKEWALASRTAKDHLLLRGFYLASALDLSTRWGDELDPLVTSFIHSSARKSRLRQRTVAMAAVVFAIISVIAGVLAFTSIQQRTIAERNFRLALASAIGLMKQVENNLRSGNLSVTVASALLTEARSTLSGLDQGGSGNELVTSQIGLYLALSQTLSASGDTQRALSTLDDARSLAESVHNRSKTGHGDDFLLGKVNLAAAEIQVSQGNFAEAKKGFLSAMQLVERAAEADPGNIEIQRVLAVIFAQSGDADMDVGRFVEASNQYKKAIDIGQSVALRDSVPGRSQQDLALTLARLGDLSSLKGAGDDALLSYTKALSLIRESVAHDPKDTYRQSLLAYLLRKNGAALEGTGALDSALTYYYEAIGVARQLSEIDPENTRWIGSLAQSYQDVGDILLNLNRLDEAAQALNTSVVIDRNLVARDPQNANWQYNLAISNSKLMDLDARRGDFSAARSKGDVAISIIQQLQKLDQDNKKWSETLSQLQERRQRLEGK